MLFLVEMIPSKWAFDIVSGVFFLAVDIFERVRIGFTCFRFKPRRVGFGICFAALC